jgi:hypothetical protein
MLSHIKLSKYHFKIDVSFIVLHLGKNHNKFKIVNPFELGVEYYLPIMVDLQNNNSFYVTLLSEYNMKAPMVYLRSGNVLLHYIMSLN